MVRHGHELVTPFPQADLPILQMGRQRPGELEAASGCDPGLLPPRPGLLPSLKPWSLICREASALSPVTEEREYPPSCRGGALHQARACHPP